MLFFNKIFQLLRNIIFNSHFKGGKINSYKLQKQIYKIII